MRLRALALSRPLRLVWLAWLLALSLVVALGACGGAPAGPAGPSAGTPLPLFPMTLVFTDAHDAGEPVGALLADGSIVHKREGLVARLLPDRVVTPDGRPKIVVAPNGDVWLDPKLPPMRFDASGALVSARGERVYVDDAGTPSWTEPRGGLPPMPVRFTPFRPEARRTAEVLLIVLMEAAWSRGMT